MNYKNIFLGLSVIFCLPIFALLGSAKAEHFQFLSNLSHDNIRRNSIHFIAWNVGTYLHKAVMEEDLKKVLEVLKNKPDLLDERGFNGKTALHEAACLGLEEIVKQLIQFGADLNKQDYDGNTAAHHALHSKNFNIVQLLINAGANFDIDNHEDDSTLNTTGDWDEE